MTMHLHHLTGCAPTPLAHYLKALGVLRIIAEQVDPEARGWWQDEHFCLLTRLNRHELEQFFLEKYAPTPIFNPWGGRSGYYPGSAERTSRMALEKIETSESQRLIAFRKAIRTIRHAIESFGGKKPDKSDQHLLIGRLRQDIRGSAGKWLDTVLALVGDDFRAPALMGTGGNEGSGSYTSAYLNAIVECILERKWDHALCLYAGRETFPGEAAHNHTWDGSFGQFIPSGHGSAWDYVLAFEGAVIVRSGITSRGNSVSHRFLASPFYFASHAIGSGANAVMDEYVLQQGRKGPGRGEQWFPIWQRPTRLDELESLVSEGRCSIGRQRARQPIDAARAISQLGVSRGITEFIRYGYLQRNNAATHFAVPLSRIVVRHRQQARLIDDIAVWLNKLPVGVSSMAARW